MDQAGRRKFLLWSAAAALFSVGAMAAFLEDVIKADWVAWAVPPLAVLGFCASLWAIRPHSFARGALWFAGLLVLAFVAIYDVLDLILDPLIRSDLMIAGAALVVLTGVWTSLSAVVAVEEG